MIILHVKTPPAIEAGGAETFFHDDTFTGGTPRNEPFTTQLR